MILHDPAGRFELAVDLLPGLLFGRHCRMFGGTVGLWPRRRLRGDAEKDVLEFLPVPQDCRRGRTAASTIFRRVGAADIDLLRPDVDLAGPADDHRRPAPPPVMQRLQRQVQALQCGSTIADANSSASASEILGGSRGRPARAWRRVAPFIVVYAVSVSCQCSIIVWNCAIWSINSSSCAVPRPPGLRQFRPHGQELRPRPARIAAVPLHRAGRPVSATQFRPGLVLHFLPAAQRQRGIALLQGVQVDPCHLIGRALHRAWGPSGSGSSALAAASCADSLRCSR